MYYTIYEYARNNYLYLFIFLINTDQFAKLYLFYDVLDEDLESDEHENRASAYSSNTTFSRLPKWTPRRLVAKVVTPMTMAGRMIGEPIML